MRYSTTSGMILAAMTIGEAMAGPTHAHMHRHLHGKKDLSDVDWSALDWNNMGIDWASAYAAGQHTSTTAAPAPTTTAAAPVAPAATTSAAAPASTHASPASAAVGGVFNEVTTAFSGLVGMANGRTTFGESTAPFGTEIGKVGNIGLPQGSNMIRTSTPESYPFSISFENTSGGPITVVLWNKAYSRTGKAADAEANLGASMAPTDPALTINLAAGETGHAAFLSETQGSFCQATDRIAASGAYATTWGEFNFVESGSGYDTSAIMNSLGNKYSMSMTSSQAAGCTSSWTSNFWTTTTGFPEGNPIPVKTTSDGSCFVNQSTAHVKVQMGGDQ